MSSNHNPAPKALSVGAAETPFVSRRRELLRECLIFLGFLALTALMTWPWVLHLRNAVADEGDSYAHAYFLWWDYHQTFHDPLNLFHATIFYPYHYTLAFGENDFGISLLFFPLFAFGFRPLTVYSVAAFLSFPFTGYSMFRLARTLSGSNSIAWVAGIVLAFIPYRFHHLSHLPLIFAGWILLLFEALVLFARGRSWTRACWLGVAFLMNALTCLTWFVLTLIPLGVSAIILLTRYRVWRDRALWLRAGATLCAASLLLVPFLLPFYHVSQLHGFVRTPAEVQMYSAHAANWLAAQEGNRLWKGLGAATDYDMALFPGIPALLLALAAVFLGLLRTRRNLLSRDKAPMENVTTGQPAELFTHALVWTTIGFMGSLGLNFFFHRALYEFVPLFRSMRAAVRWSMICYVGLALLAGLGARRLAELLNFRWPRLRTSLILGVFILAILFDQRVAPLPLLRGEADPDELTLYLKAQKMSGGIVELPAGENSPRYMLRAADHGHPLVTARDSFTPPIEHEIESLIASQPIPDRLLDLFETIPASYVTIHNSLVSPERRMEMEGFFNRGTVAGRLRFIKSFERGLPNGLRERNDLYAVVKTEPEARSEGLPPPPLSRERLDPLFSDLVANFQATGFFAYRLYKASYGRAPRFEEFMPDVQLLNPANGAEKLEESKRAFAEAFGNRPSFQAKYDRLNDEQYVDTLLAQTKLTSAEGQREKLLDGLHKSAMTRAAVMRNVADNNVFAAREFNAAFVLVHYFAYLKRDPDEGGYQFWLYKLNHSPDYPGFTEAFAASTERQLKLNQP